MTVSIGFTYHKDYNKYDFGVDHPLVGDKPRRTLTSLVNSPLINSLVLLSPPMASEEDLLRVHEQKYVEHVKNLSTHGGMLAKDTPAPQGIFESARLATGGTIYAANRLLHDFSVVVNPLAGFHHASTAFSSGFCFFNDIAVAIEYIREKYHISRFMIIDMDVHHANGTQDIFYRDPSVLTVSMHQDGRTLYPGTGSIEKIGADGGVGFNVNIPFPPGAGNKSYRFAFEALVPPLVTQFRPELLIYQAGVDTHHSDPLADIMITYPFYYWLGDCIATLAEQSCRRLLVCLGGGYNSNTCIKAYYNVLSGLLHFEQSIVEPMLSEHVINQVHKIVDQVKEHLQDYWSFTD
ncbi:MAG: acetoin utilization protein AcuC [Candidatus Thermoplasmatota archaeon]|nr:acetoin utilization protein AcuC [Candidatus Thermoplasmatota archaeon]MBU1941599.1 acetoin utilization protein AcuC [Candidatus Thermoplasmatota archaeon]